MGHLIYGSGSDYEIDDRTLAHLKVAIVAKLRLQEGFLVNWTMPGDQGEVRVSAWLAPFIPIQFRFSGPEPAELNHTWLEALGTSAHGMRGMVVMPEEDAAAYLEHALNLGKPGPRSTA